MGDLGLFFFSDLLLALKQKDERENIILLSRIPEEKRAP
jgi:hypothetical protein